MRRAGHLAVRLRALIGYVPVLLKVIIAIALGIGVFAAYQAASAASFFQLSTVEVQGESRASLSRCAGLGETGSYEVRSLAS